MPRDKHVRALAAEIAAQDAELLQEFDQRARWGQGDYAVAYAVLRFGQTVTRLITAMCRDDEEQRARQPQAAETPCPEPEPQAAIPEPAAIGASAATKPRRRARPANGQ